MFPNIAYKKVEPLGNHAFCEIGDKKSQNFWNLTCMVALWSLRSTSTLSLTHVTSARLLDFLPKTVLQIAL